MPSPVGGLQRLGPNFGGAGHPCAAFTESKAMQNALVGQRVLITQSTEFMGPALCEVFAEQGATVIASTAALAEPGAAERVVQSAGDFAALVEPLPRLVGAAAPAMLARRSGKILVIGSAAALRGMKRASAYSTARGAQLAHVQAVGVEFAPHNMQVNAIAQNFVDNPTYFPAEAQANPRFQARLAQEVPLGRLVSAREDALFAACLCSSAADCFVEQVLPVSGGWAAR